MIRLNQICPKWIKMDQAWSNWISDEIIIEIYHQNFNFINFLIRFNQVCPKWIKMNQSWSNWISDETIIEIIRFSTLSTFWLDWIRSLQNCQYNQYNQICNIYTFYLFQFSSSLTTARSFYDGVFPHKWKKRHLPNGEIINSK